jgi:hypothetical protein
LGYSGGWSLQRQAGGGYGTGTATPDLPNGSHPSLPCEQGVFPIRRPGDAVDRVRPLARLGGKKVQRLSKLSVTVRVDERATVLASGAVKVGRRKLALRKVKRVVRAQTKVVLRLRLSRRGRSTVRAALAQGRRATAAVKVKATDGSGNSSSKRRTIRVLP